MLRYFLNVLAFLPLSGNQTNKTRDTKNFPIYSFSFPEPGNGGNLIFQMVMLIGLLWLYSILVLVLNEVGIYAELLLITYLGWF